MKRRMILLLLCQRFVQVILIVVIGLQLLDISCTNNNNNNNNRKSTNNNTNHRFVVVSAFLRSSSSSVIVSSTTTTRVSVSPLSFIKLPLQFRRSDYSRSYQQQQPQQQQQDDRFHVYYNPPEAAPIQPQLLAPKVGKRSTLFSSSSSSSTKDIYQNNRNRKQQQQQQQQQPQQTVQQQHVPIRSRLLRNYRQQQQQQQQQQHFVRGRIRNLFAIGSKQQVSSSSSLSLSSSSSVLSSSSSSSSTTKIINSSFQYAGFGTIPSLLLSMIGSLSILPVSIRNFLSVHRKIVLWGTIVVAVTYRILLPLYFTRRRLAEDITSEWSRYAQYPNARTRASIFIATKVMLYTILAQFLKLWQRTNQYYSYTYWMERAGRTLTLGLLQLGPLYIKLGQIISCQDTLVPTEWRKALEVLHDNVPSWDGDRALQLAYAAWPYSKEDFHTTFLYFNTTPIAAASLGQVHIAVLNPNSPRCSSILASIQQGTTTSRGSTLERSSMLFDITGICDQLEQFVSIPPLLVKNGKTKTNGVQQQPPPSISSPKQQPNQQPSVQLVTTNRRSTSSTSTMLYSSSNSTSSNNSNNNNNNNRITQPLIQVAIKLQRSYLKEIYDNDFTLLMKIANIVDTWTEKIQTMKQRRRRQQQQQRRLRDSNSFDDESDNGLSSSSSSRITNNWTNIFSTAKDILYREIDYRDEAENAQRFIKNFGLGYNGSESTYGGLIKGFDNQTVVPSAASWLRTPYVFSELSDERILVMEYVPSIKITNVNKLSCVYNITTEDRIYLAECLGRAYLRQFCIYYHFSTDPHPGNLGIEIKNPNGTTPADRVRLVFYDFGQATTLEPQQGEGILQIIEAIVDMDVDKSITAFQTMGVLKDNANITAVTAQVSENYKTGKVKANRKRLRAKGYQFRPPPPPPKASSSNNNNGSSLTTNSSGTTTTTTTTNPSSVMQYFTLPAEYAFVARAITQMDGVGKTLDPEFDFISAAAPYLYEIKGANKYIQDEFSKFLQKQFPFLADFFVLNKNNNNNNNNNNYNNNNQQKMSTANNGDPTNDAIEKPTQKHEASLTNY